MPGTGGGPLTSMSDRPHLYTAKEVFLTTEAYSFPKSIQLVHGRVFKSDLSDDRAILFSLHIAASVINIVLLVTGVCLLD